MKLNGLVPMLETENLRETIEFYMGLLGFECNGFYPDEKDPCWVSLVKDEVVIMFSDKDRSSEIGGAVITGTLYLYPANVNELWENLKDKAPIAYPIEDFDYGMREFGIKDNNGYILQFGQDLETLR